MSYTSVLQRTFNLNISIREENSEDETEIEFSMIDVESYAGIDGYIKKHGLNDASLVASRRAKVYGVNAPRKGKDGDAAAQNGETNGEAGEDDGLTELQKAEMALQDAEDEEEEDYVDEDEEDDSGSSEDGGSDVGEDGAGDVGEEDEVEAEYEEEAGGYEDEDQMQET